MLRNCGASRQPRHVFSCPRPRYLKPEVPRAGATIVPTSPCQWLRLLLERGPLACRRAGWAGAGVVGEWRSEADGGGKSGSQSSRKGCVVRRFVLLQPFINRRAQRVLADKRRQCPLPLTFPAAAPHTSPFSLPSAPLFTNLLYGTMAPSHMASCRSCASLRQSSCRS